jgi:hypothetical protein
MWFGYFIANVNVTDTYPPNPRNFHTNVVLALKSPVVSVDAYIRGRLSPNTIALLAAYPASETNVTSAQLAAMETALLDDFNEIVLGPSIWDPLRFASVTPPVRVTDDGVDPVTPAERVDQILKHIKELLEDNKPETNPSEAEIQ